jgi:hypothetical protein
MNKHETIQVLEAIRENLERMHRFFLKYPNERQSLRIRQIEEEHKYLNPIRALDIAIDAVKAQIVALQHADAE